MTRTWPLHGTADSYRKGCRCYFCCDADTEYNRLHRPKYRRVKVSSKATRAHILRLNSHGMGNDSIAACCGVGHTTVMRIRQGKAKLIYRRTAERIRSVNSEGMEDGCRVDAAFTHSLIWELLEEGWTQAQLAKTLASNRTSLSFMRRKKVYASTQLKVQKLYRKAMNEGLRRAA